MSLTAAASAPAVYQAGPPDTGEIDGTLLSIVTPTNGGAHERPFDGHGIFPSYDCIETGFALSALCGPTAGNKYDGAQNPGWQDGLGFGAYGMVICKMVEPEEMGAGTERAYTRAESRTIEAAIMEGLFVEQTTSGTQGGWDAAEDLTPVAATPVDPLIGLGILESHTARYYAQKPILHMPRLIGTLLSKRGVIEKVGSRLYTALGTPIAAGGGYDLPNTGPDGNDAPAGSKWIYATGAISIVRQKLPRRDVFNIYTTDDDVTGLDPNTFVSLTEYAYLATIDCYKTAVLVTADEV